MLEGQTDIRHCRGLLQQLYVQKTTIYGIDTLGKMSKHGTMLGIEPWQNTGTVRLRQTYLAVPVIQLTL